jgi:hypothetical protein
MVTVFSSALIVAACGGSDGGGVTTSKDGGADATSGSSSSGSSGSSGSGTTTCSALAQAGASIDIKGAKLPIPEAAGGTPVDGTFVLTSIKAFSPLLTEGGTVSAFGAYTLVISSGGRSFEQIVTDEDNAVTRAKGDLALDGVNFTATPTCEDPLSEDGGVTIISGKFTADASSLKMYVVRDFGITAELLFEKR